MSGTPTAGEALAERILADAHKRAASVAYAGVRTGMIRAAERKAARARAGLLVDWTPSGGEDRAVPRPRPSSRGAQVPRDVIGLDGRQRETQRRACLRCRQQFDSAGSGNRMCEPCRAKAAEASPLAV